jgi:hypothetical protein
MPLPNQTPSQNSWITESAPEPEPVDNGGIREVTFMLRAVEKETAQLALKPTNPDWQKSAVEFFQSLRNRSWQI